MKFRIEPKKDGSGSWLHGSGGRIVGSTRRRDPSETNPGLWSFHIFTVDVHAYFPTSVYPSEPEARAAAITALEENFTLEQRYAKDEISQRSETMDITTVPQKEEI